MSFLEIGIKAFHYITIINSKRGEKEDFIKINGLLPSQTGYSIDDKQKKTVHPIWMTNCVTQVARKIKKIPLKKGIKKQFEVLIQLYTIFF